jgi:two-component system NtrC family response regulator
MEAGSMPASRDQRRRILLIEDAPSVARVTAIVLDGAGYSVKTAANHRAARQILTNEDFSLILADTDHGAGTAGLSGLAELVASVDCPVVLFTAHRFSEVDIETAGFAGVVRKPYDIDDLLRIVNDALCRSAADGNLTTPV